MTDAPPADLFRRVSALRSQLLQRAALPEWDLDGHRPHHYLNAAQALGVLETTLASGAEVDDTVRRTVGRAFCQANELVQLRREDLAEFSVIAREVEALSRAPVAPPQPG